MKKLVPIICAIAWLTIVDCSRALAYIPPSEFLLNTWVKKHPAVKKLQLHSLVTAYLNGKPTDTHFKETVFINFEKSVLQSLTIDDANKKLFSMEKKLTDLSPVSKSLFSSNPSDVLRSMREIGIPIQVQAEAIKPEVSKLESEEAEPTPTPTALEIKSLGRLNGKVAWVIGSEDSKDQTSPQIWLEKDTFLPLRMIYASPGQPIYDFQFENFRYYREFPFPKVIKVIGKNGQVVFSSELINIAVNSESSNSTAGLAGYTETGKSASSDLRNLIRIYYDLMR